MWRVSRRAHSGLLEEGAERGAEPLRVLEPLPRRARVRVDQAVAEPVRLPRMHAEVRVRRRDVVVVSATVGAHVGRAYSARGEGGGTRERARCGARVLWGDRARRGAHMPDERFAKLLG